MLTYATIDALCAGLPLDDGRDSAVTLLVPVRAGALYTVLGIVRVRFPLEEKHFVNKSSSPIPSISTYISYELRN